MRKLITIEQFIEDMKAEGLEIDQVYIDPETNHVWLKLLIDDSDPSNLTASWREKIESTIVRNGVVGTLSISIDIEFWRGERPED